MLNYKFEYNMDSFFIVFCLLMFIGLFFMIYNINLISQNNFNISTIYNKLIRNVNKNNSFINTTEGFKVKADFSNKNINTKINKINKKQKDPYDLNIDYSKYGKEEFYEQFNNRNQRLNNIRTKQTNNNVNKINNKNIKKHKLGRKSKIEVKANQFINSKKPYTKINKTNKSNFTNIKSNFTNIKPNSNNKNKIQQTTKDNKKNKIDNLSLLQQISNDNTPGSVDTFQNVLDELDNIDAGTFKFKNISGVVSNYNDNIKNRLKYAEKKGYNNYDKTIAKGSILFDELKKLMSYTALT